MRPLLVAAGAWPSVPPRHRATAIAEARAVAADGAATTTRWSGGDDGSIVRWETKAGDADLGERVAPVAFLGGHAGRVTALAVSEEDSLLLSGDDDGVVRAWDTRTNACVARRDFSTHASPFLAVVSIEIIGATSTSPRIVRARFVGESQTRSLEPRTLRSVKDGDDDDYASHTSTVPGELSIPFDPETCLANAWRHRAASRGVYERDETKTKTETDVRPRATSCRLLRGGAVSALAVGLEDGDVLIEQLVRPVRAAVNDKTPETKRVASRGDNDSRRVNEKSVATLATIGGLLVAGDADGSVTFWDVDSEVKRLVFDASERSFRGRPSLVATLRHHVRAVRGVLALPMAAEDGDANEYEDEDDVAVSNRTRTRRLGVSVDAEGVVGVLSVTDVPSRNDVDANAPGGAWKRARCEMLLRPRLRATRDDVDDETRDASVADVRLVWDRRRGVLTVLRSYSFASSDDTKLDGVKGKWSYDAVAYDILGNTVERSIENDDAALAFFAAARSVEGAAYARVGGGETTTEFIALRRSDTETTETEVYEYETVESELRVGNVARALVVDVVALLERRERTFARTRLRRLAAAMHAWGRDDDADVAARDAFFGLDGKENETRMTNARFGYLVPAVLGVGRAVSVAVPSENDGESFETDPRSEAARAVAVAAIAARLAFVEKRKEEKPEPEPETQGLCTSSSSASLHAAVARLSTLQTFTTPEHLAFFARLRHSPCVEIQDAARALFHANAIKTAGGSLEAGGLEPSSSTRTLLESARLAIAAAEASLVAFVAAERTHTGNRLERERASRKAEALAEEAVDLSMPAVVAAATMAAQKDTGDDARREDVSRGESPASVARALIELLAAPRASIVADAASLLAEGTESRGWARALSEAELDAARSVTFALAEALGSVRAVADDDSATRRVLGASNETMTARDATGALLAALATARPRAFLDTFSSRLKSARFDSPAHMSAFLALAKVARERPSALERHLDAVAGVVAAASSSSTPALRKTCRAGARALVTDLAQHSGRVAYFASRNRDVERLAVAVEESEESSASLGHFFSRGGVSGIARRSIHVYDLVIGAKTKILKEEDDETVVAADESGAAAAAAAYAARAANELSGAFSATLGALASPNANDARLPTRKSLDGFLRSEDDKTVSKTVPRVRIERVEAFSETSETASPGIERRSPTANRTKATTPVRRSVDVIPSPDPSDGNQQYAAAAAAAAMALAANKTNHQTHRRGQSSRRGSPRASPRSSPRVSSNFSSPKSVETYSARLAFSTDDDDVLQIPLPAFALAFDDDGSRLAGYRDAKGASRVRVWHVSPASLFSRPSAFANLASFGARVSGAVAGAAGASGVAVVAVGCAESFPCGDTALMDDVFFGSDINIDASTARSKTIVPKTTSKSVTLEWRGGSAVVLRRGNVEAAFGVKKE